MIAIRVKTRNRQFLTRMDALMRQTPPLRDESIRVMGTRAIEWIMHKAPRDTNRYVRAVAEAGNKATLGPVAVPTVEVFSKYLERHENVLLLQIEEWEKKSNNIRKRINFLYPKGQPAKNSRLYNKLIRQRDKTDMVLQRAKEEYQKHFDADPAPLLMGLSRWRQDPKGRNLITVRTKVYGGDGKFISQKHGASVILTLKEPHAQFVEKKHKLFSTVRRVLYTQGLAEFKRTQSLLASRSGLSVSAAMKGGR